MLATELPQAFLVVVKYMLITERICVAIDAVETKVEQ